MAALARPFFFLGSLLLLHAAYSAHEYTTLLTHTAPSSSSPSTQPLTVPQTSSLSSLPLDITLETIASVILLCVAIVGASEELKPISWRAWAGQIEQNTLEGKVKEGGQDEGFGWLDTGKRRGFLDIRAQRRDFAEWAKGNQNT
ncbi:MAG: hypothetical protein MMC23_004968 [Stictis urceolatum]|nr:hypothetical protein [Stictis urceolata]